MYYNKSWGKPSMAEWKEANPMNETKSKCLEIKITTWKESES